MNRVDEQVGTQLRCSKGVTRRAPSKEPFLTQGVSSASMHWSSRPHQALLHEAKIAQRSPVVLVCQAT